MQSSVALPASQRPRQCLEGLNDPPVRTRPCALAWPPGAQAAKVAKGGSLEHLWEAKEYAGIKEGVIKRLQVLHTVDSSKL
jgi:hypothetical protein